MIGRRWIALGFLLLTGSWLWAQSYRCDWQVIAVGGGMLAGSYRCGVTVGQTATGLMSGPNLLALVGFWQPEVATGIAERDQIWQEGPVANETRLYPVLPNPFSGATRIRYTLNCEQRTLVQICDISGRVVRTLVNSVQPAGTYTLTWDTRDNAGREVAAGIYFCRFSAGGYRRSTKLVLQR
ncbi:MAG: T9SS type A sorting domain-containing protein [candidate division WOR-3 bacterium]|uniref:T9SS type A sorting domain-containing protein n=1 Tax=candidate division WOR-3 bacterium TaxID=2052148 RepID=A0A7C3II56_UNCW3|nr:T9SS type A sorting domain-containing protein [candidate division WOR-3 bacterium]